MAMIQSINPPTGGTSIVSSLSMNSSEVAFNEESGDDLHISVAPETILSGRDSEAEQLMRAFRRVAAGSSEVVLVSGVSGTGKSSLVENLRRPAAAAGGYFVSAKFDQVRTNSPFSALSAALSDLCDLVAQDEETLPNVRRRIKRIVQNETIALSSIISNLAQVTGEAAWSSSEANMSQTFQRFKISCTLFIRAIATPEHPIVIFLDDLQWSDVESLVVLRSLAADLESKNVLLIGAYRSDESSAQTVTETFQFDTNVGDNGDEAALCLRQTRFELGNLDADAVNSVIAHMLQMPASSEATKELSKVIHIKTHGNAFFVLALMHNLEMDGMLQFNPIPSLWSWDIEVIRDEIVVTENVLSLLQQRLYRLPSEVQDLLTVAAFMGFTFRFDVLVGFVHQERQVDQDSTTAVEGSLELLLKQSVKEGLIEEAGTGRFRFGHDKIQQCLLDLVGNGKAQEELRHRLGWFLHERADLYGEDVLFAAADNLNHGEQSQAQESQRVNIAEVNLAAGVAAKRKSAFRSAAEYASQGLAMLGTQLPWNQNYNLTLGLTTLFAESQYCLGDFAQAMKMVNEVLHYAENDLEKVPAYVVSIDTIAALGEIPAALQKCIQIVRELGDKFPKKPNNVKVIVQFAKMKKRMKRVSDEDILNLPKMEDKHILAIAKVHRSLQLYAILTNQQWHIAASVLRMLYLSLKYGYSSLTPSALAIYGMVFVDMGDIDTAHHYASLALRLQDIIGYKQGRCRTALMTHCCCLHYKDNINNAVLPLRNAIFDGLASGDIDESFFMVGMYAMTCMNSGIRLSEIVDDLEHLDQQFTDYNNHTLLLYKAVMTFAMNFMGMTERVLTLSSDVLNEDQAFREAEAANDKVTVASMQAFKLILHYHFGSLTAALKYAKILIKTDHVGKTNPQFYISRFYFGMVFFQMARETGKRKYVSMARRKSMKIVRRFEESPNAKPLLLLLKAEYAAVRRRPLHYLENLYIKAIESAADEGFIQIEALANEQASKALSGESTVAGDKFRAEAIELYHAWDATAKVEYLEEQ